MTEERPDDAREPDGSVTPDTGGDGLEARPASAPDAPFSGLRSAADIFGAPRTEDEWPSRRERREAERAAQEAGVPVPDPFVPAPESAPAPSSAVTPGSHVTPTSAPAPTSAAQPASAPTPAPVDDPLATQAISMPEELAALSGVAGRVPPPAVVPPVSNAPDPRAITLPTAQAARDARAAEARALDEERRRLDPDGTGRNDVDWLGRARRSPEQPAAAAPFPVTGPVGVPQPVGVEGVLPAASAPSTTEPPSFTELLRLQDEPSAGPQEGRPFDWSVLGEDTGEVPTTLTSAAYDTTLVAADSWANAPVPPVVPAAPTVLDATAPGSAPRAEAPAHGDDVADEVTTPSGSSWSLSDEAARTGEVFPGDVEGPAGPDTSDATAVLGPAPVQRTPEDDARGDGRGDDARWDDARWADARWAAAQADGARDARADDRADQGQDGADVGTAVLGVAALGGAGVGSARDDHPDLDDASDRVGSAPRTMPDDHGEPDHDDVHDEHDGVSTPPRSAAALPWWNQDGSGTLPPLVPPAEERHEDLRGFPVPLVPEEHDRIEEHDRLEERDRYGDDEHEVVGAAGRAAPEDLDQSEWDGRETSDTSVIKDLFGTEAVHQLGATDYNPHDTGTRMMPAVQPGPDAPAAAASGTRDEHGNFITEGFGRLQSEGRRGKQLLVSGSIAAIVVLLVLVFILTRVLLGNTIEDHPAPPTKSPAAAAAPSHPVDHRS